MGSFTIPISTNTIESLIFDKAGNLYAPTHFGDFAHSGYRVSIYKFTPLQLTAAAPVGTILVNTMLVRANQMAFDADDSLCIADFTGTVECFNSSSGASVRTHMPEFNGAQPLGIGFDSEKRMLASDAFKGNVFRELRALSGRFDRLEILTSTSLTIALEYLTQDSAGSIYVGSWHDANTRAMPCGNLYACIDWDTRTDVIYKIDPITGEAKSFISDHIWGPNRMVFYEY
jgi:hypothetical protein